MFTPQEKERFLNGVIASASSEFPQLGYRYGHPIGDVTHTVTVWAVTVRSAFSVNVKIEFSEYPYHARHNLRTASLLILTEGI